MNKEDIIKRLRKIAILFARKRTCNNGSIARWLKIVHYAHNHGFLYVGFEGDDVDLACIAYRTEADDPKHGDVLPLTEEGDSLYVCAVASRTKDTHKLRRLLTWYLRENPQVTSLTYHKRNSEDYVTKRLKVRNGKKQKSRHTTAS